MGTLRLDVDYELITPLFLSGADQASDKRGKDHLVGPVGRLA